MGWTIDTQNVVGALGTGTGTDSSGVLGEGGYTPPPVLVFSLVSDPTSEFRRWFRMDQSLRKNRQSEA